MVSSIVRIKEIGRGFDCALLLFNEQGVCLTDWFGQGKSWPTEDPAPSIEPSLVGGFEWGFGTEAAPLYKDLTYSLDMWTAQLEYFLDNHMPEHHGMGNSECRLTVHKACVDICTYAGM